MKPSSGSVNSWLASERTNTASDAGISPSVLAACGLPAPPTPGVSTRTNPSARSGLGTLTSTRSTSRPSARGRGRGDAVQLVERQGHADRVCARIGEDEFRRRGLGVLHDGGDRGGLVVAHRTDSKVEQRVHELALALLERTDHHDPHPRVLNPGPGGVEPLRQITATEPLRHVQGLLEQRRHRLRPGWTLLDGCTVHELR